MSSSVRATKLATRCEVCSVSIVMARRNDWVPFRKPRNTRPSLRYCSTGRSTRSATPFPTVTCNYEVFTVYLMGINSSRLEYSIAQNVFPGRLKNVVRKIQNVCIYGCNFVFSYHPYSQSGSKMKIHITLLIDAIQKQYPSWLRNSLKHVVSPVGGRPWFQQETCAADWRWCLVPTTVQNRDKNTDTRHTGKSKDSETNHCTLQVEMGVVSRLLACV